METKSLSRAVKDTSEVLVEKLQDHNTVKPTVTKHMKKVYAGWMAAASTDQIHVIRQGGEASSHEPIEKKNAGIAPERFAD